MRNIVFLDIDGVLNSLDYFKREGIDIKELNKLFGKLGKNSRRGRDLQRQCFDPEAVERLNTITTERNAGIVLSTNWVMRLGVDHVARLLKEVGVTGDILGQTPRKFSLEDRAYEIGMWLDRNPVASFVILEDYHPLRDLETRTVRTNIQEGLLDYHIEQAFKILDTYKKPDPEEEEEEEK